MPNILITFSYLKTLLVVIDGLLILILAQTLRVTLSGILNLLER